jgi:cobaltochelatase CobN
LNKPRRERTRVIRLDGKPINIVKRRGHLMVCAKGCCCGHTERGYAAVPVDFYKQEYKRRKLRNVIQLSMNGCLGPCPLANVALLFFDGRSVWLQSLNTHGQIVALFDYIEQMLAAGRYLPPPAELQEYVFDYYAWTGQEQSSRGGEGEKGRAGDNATGSCPVAPGLPLSPSPRLPVSASIVFLSHADTDLLTLHHALALLPSGFPPIETMTLAKIATAEHMAALLDGPLGQVGIVIVRVLGGVSSVPGLDLLTAHMRRCGRHLLLLSGTGAPDRELAAASIVAAAVADEANAYLQMGGVANFAQCLRFLADRLLMTRFGCDPPREQPPHGLYHPDLPAGATLSAWLARRDPNRPTVGLLFYRAHWMSGNLAFIDILVHELERQGANALPVFTTTLKETAAPPAGVSGVERWPAACTWFFHDGTRLIDVLISTISFAMGEINLDGPTPSGWSVDALAALNVPVLQAICAGAKRWQWEASSRGLNPLDTAMNVALPEFDGRIITVPVSFKKELGERSEESGEEDTGRHSAQVVHYQADVERCARVAGLARRFAELRRKPNHAKKIAFILTNSPGKAARIGNAVGLDAPASLIKVFEAMRQRGYDVADVPADGDSLIKALIDRCSYDEVFLAPAQLARAAANVPAGTYQRWFDELPESARQRMIKQWGPPPGAAFVHHGKLALAGLQLGNVFVALQPPRGYGMDPSAIYHQPDLPPTHHYFALYRWLRDVWQADAIVHMGKHGTLEWLPGKGVGLSAECYPDAFLADLPLFYPFILNDPGEGAQAKRRGHAVVIDHLTPPMTSADAYGPLGQLMQLVDEYYQVEMLDPSKIPLVQKQIWDMIESANLHADLKFLMQQNHGDHVHEWEERLTSDGTPVSLAQMRGQDVAHLIQELDGYLCELAGAQIRDGLHILGQAPAGEQLVGLLQALTRVPNLDLPSLPQALARLFRLDWQRLTTNKGGRLEAVASRFLRVADRPVVTHADALEVLDELGRHVLELLEHGDFQAGAIDNALQGLFETEVTDAATHEARRVFTFISDRLVPALRRTPDEIANLLRGLEGEYVPAGPSGAPTRGMAHVLPTGRNFYAVDPRAVPSAAAWQVGQELAREVLERHRQETGVYPESVGISIWGTSAMRTHGDDVAEVLSLLGVRPVWQPESRRLTGVEVIPLAELRRPRVDVTIRISGFFRDAFPHLIRLLDEAVQAVIVRDEPLEQNFVRKHYLADLAEALAAGASDGEAAERAAYRIFGSKPGCYGAGLLPLIDERNWQGDADLAETYVNWGGYAYTAGRDGVDARPTYRRRLAQVEVALHNQDNREHDIFDSDDYFQFHGGMIATIRALTGRQPKHYFGDTHDPARPAVRDLKQEVLRVFRTRVVNPKWLDSITRHGYKGGLELAATVDYLFGYDATAKVVDDWMYEEVAETYALDPALQEFFARSNPWAWQALTERLLEASERGLWQQPKPETLAELKNALLAGETLLESRGEAEALPVAT